MKKIIRSSVFLNILFLTFGSFYSDALKANSKVPCINTLELLNKQGYKIGKSQADSLKAICKNKNFKNDMEKKAITISLWLKNNVHPASELVSRKDYKFHVYNELSPFLSKKPAYYSRFLTERLGNQNYVRYVLSSKRKDIKVGDRIGKDLQGFEAVRYKEPQKTDLLYYRSPWEKSKIAAPYHKVSFVNALVDYSKNSKKVIRFKGKKIDYFHYFDLNNIEVNNLLTSTLLGPTAGTEITLIDLRGPTGNLKSNINSMLIANHGKIKQQVAKRAFYVMVDRHTEGFKNILAKYLQEIGAIVYGEVPYNTPNFKGFHVIEKSYLLMLPTEASLFTKFKKLEPDVEIKGSLAYSGGVDKVYEKVLADIVK